MGCETSVDIQQNNSEETVNQLQQSPPLIQSSPPPIQSSLVKSEEDILFADAQQLENKSKYVEAIEIYLKLLQCPKKVEVLRALGGCYRQIGKYDESIKCSLESFNIEKHEECCRSISVCYRFQKDYNHSMQWVIRGMEINPQSASLYADQGSTYKQMRQFQKAQESFIKSIELDIGYSFAFDRLVILLKDQKRYEQCTKWYKKIIEAKPNNVKAMYQLSVVYKNNLRNIKQAIKWLKRVLEIDQKYSPALNTFGNIKIDIKQWIEAEELFRKAIKIDPKFSCPYNGLGNSLFEQKRFNEAKQSYMKAIQLNEKYSTPFSGLGDVYYQTRQLQKSIQSYQQSIKLNPKDVNPYNGMGNSYKLKGNYQQAIKWYNKAIEINPSKQNPYNGIGNAYRQLGNFKLAQQYYLKAIKINPKFYYPYNGIGNIYQAKLLYEEAEKWYLKCVDMNPNYHTVYNNIGNMLTKRTKYEEAKTYFQKCLNLNPKFEGAYNNLALVHVYQGKYKQAIEIFQKCIQVNSQYALAYINMALCLVRIENYSEAFKLLKKGKDIIEQSDRDVFGGCKTFITSQLTKFEANMPDWQYKAKLGYLTEEDKERIQNLRKQFEKKFKSLFNANQGDSENIDPSSFRLEFISILDKIFEDAFSLKEIEGIASLNFEIFKSSMDDFSIMPFIFCKYFWEQKMVHKRSIKDIEETLDTKIGRLNELYPPSIASSSESQNLNLKRQVPQKTVNLFKSVEYFQDYRYLVKEIESIHSVSILVLPKFKEFIYKISSECGGYHSKANLKLPDNESQRFKVYIRVMEKMFKEIKTRKDFIIEKIDKKIESEKSVSMQAVLQYLIEVWTEEINNILKNRKENHIPTICNITDFVRGKSMFKTVLQIEAAANKLIDQLDALGHEITEIDNRLQKETKDLVFKILVDGIVCEYQMALETDTIQYNYSHCYYEIKRSPLGCIFGSYLFLSKYEVLSFAKQAKQIFSFYKYKKDEEALRRIKSANFFIQALQKNI